MRPIVRIAGWTAIIICALGVAAAAAEPDAHTIMQRMKAVLEPVRPSTRKISMVTSVPKQPAAEWHSAQARKKLADGNRILTVMFAPESVSGSAQLVWEKPDGSAVQWIYLPFVRRVRKITLVDAYEHFLGSEFTYADLGFVNLQDREIALVDTETHNGVQAYKVQETPRDQWHYARIVTWVTTDTLLPQERDFYDPDNQLWKTEHFEDVSVIDGAPTPLRIRVQNVQEDVSSELRVSEVRYDVQIPDALFDPDRLPEVAHDPLWQTVAHSATPHS